MKISTLLEFAINPQVEQMLDDGVARIWGGQLQRAVEEIGNSTGSRRQVHYFASKVAEIRNLEWIVVRIQGRVTYITAERLEDNSPKEIQYGDLPLPSSEKAEILNDIAGAGLLPPYIENLWMEEGDEIQKAAAEIQDRWRAGRVASSADDTAARVTATSNTDSTFNVDDIRAAIDRGEEETSVVNDGGNIEVVSDTSNLNNLVSFASSGKGGLANDFDEKDAINELQTFLVNLGLNVGNNGVDGLYGRKTVAAVKKFQSAIKDLAVDGDAGPRTIQAISTVESDLLRMQELVDRHLSESFTYKSNLARLLEADLTDAESAELQELIDKYKDFSTEFPGFMDGLYTKAQEAAAGVQTFPLDNDEVVSTDDETGSDTTDGDLGEDPRMPKVGDLSTPLMTDMLKDFDPTQYPMAGEPITIEDIEILKNETQYDKRTDPGYPYSPSNIVEPEYDAKDVDDGFTYYWREENGRITFLRSDTLERKPDANFDPWITFDPNGEIKHVGNTIQLVKNEGDEISVVSISEDNAWSTNLVKLLKQRYPEKTTRINDPEIDDSQDTNTDNTTTDTTTNGLTIVTSPGNGVGQIQINRARELSYTILKTSDNPPKFRYRDPGDNVSSTVYDNVQDMMKDIEKFAELRRRAGTFKQ